MTPLTLLVLVLQLRAGGLAPSPALAPAHAPPDPQRVLRRARDAQARFERARRSMLPVASGSSGRCDVHIGRYCWWNDEGAPIPAEPHGITARRASLLTELDSLGALLPTDDWLAGIRVYYHVEARQLAAADSAAHQCRASAWWCGALIAYAAHARHDVVTADSTFGAALAQMPDTLRCRWHDISVLLPGDTRGRYEDRSCEERASVEARYWMLSTPRLAGGGNEWRAEFYARRVVATLLQRGNTPYPERWGSDMAELGLRYGWPVAWSRIPSANPMTDARIIGHDPTPSFPFVPREELLDSLASGSDDGWDFRDPHAPARFAPGQTRRIVSVRTQLARFQRGDSTLLVASYQADDDSLRAPAASLAAVLADGRILVATADTGRAGRLRLSLPAAPRLAGVELTDTASGTLARSRQLYAPRADSNPPRLSDLLVFLAGSEVVPHLDSALASALSSEVVSRAAPLGVYWETYGIAQDGDQMGTELAVERIDQGFFRRVGQRLGLADADSPLRIRWSDAHPGAAGVSPRAVSLDLANLPGGRYRITLTLTPAGSAPLVSAREVDLTER